MNTEEIEKLTEELWQKKDEELNRKKHNLKSQWNLLEKERANVKQQVKDKNKVIYELNQKLKEKNKTIKEKNEQLNHFKTRTHNLVLKVEKIYKVVEQRLGEAALSTVKYYEANL